MTTQDWLALTLLVALLIALIVIIIMEEASYRRYQRQKYIDTMKRFDSICRDAGVEFDDSFLTKGDSHDRK